MVAWKGEADLEGLSSLGLYCYLHPENLKSLSFRHFSGRKEHFLDLQICYVLGGDSKIPSIIALHHPSLPEYKYSQGIDFDSFPCPPFPVGVHMYSFTCPKRFLLPSLVYHVLLTSPLAAHCISRDPSEKQIAHSQEGDLIRI